MTADIGWLGVCGFGGGLEHFLKLLLNTCVRFSFITFSGDWSPRFDWIRRFFRVFGLMQRWKKWTHAMGGR